ncbi:hypothetical protein KXD40_007431 [Peronospora effusa]|nr:hypothetical protein KXD40_007431 [Peronospora effusa]
MYFNKFYAHQVNLTVKDVFKVVHVDRVARVKALTMAYNKSASIWLCTESFRKCITNFHGYKDDTSRASFVMQRKSTSLADVLNMFDLLYQAFAKASQHADEL